MFEEKTLKEKISFIKNLEAKGFKTYLRNENIDLEYEPAGLFEIKTYIPKKQIFNEEIPDCTYLIEEDELDKVEGLNIIDITHLPLIEQIKITHKDFIEELREDSKKLKEDFDYWYIRDIGNFPTYKNKQMNLLMCLNHYEACMICEIILEGK